MLGARNAQTGKAIDLKRAFPGKVFFFRKLVVTAGILESDLAAADCGDHRGFATDYPSLGAGGRQAFHERHADQCLIRKRPSGAAMLMVRPRLGRIRWKRSRHSRWFARSTEAIPSRNSIARFHKFLTFSSEFVTKFFQTRSEIIRDAWRDSLRACSDTNLSPSRSMSHCCLCALKLQLLCRKGLPRQKSRLFH